MTGIKDNEFAGKTVALIGAGVSNMPLVPFFVSRGAAVTVRDSKSEETMGEKAEKIKGYGAKLIAGDGYLDVLCEDIIVRSPGIRPDIPEFRTAVANGSTLTSEMELFLSHTKCKVWAVTGSDGKSTTTTVLSKLLEGGAGKTYLGGNIGSPLCHLYPEMTEDDRAAVELSSFQLMTIDAEFEAAIVTNVTPNHLNWHTGMDEYIAAKERILRRAKRAVLNAGNKVTREMGKRCSCPVTWFSREPIRDGILRDGDSAIYLDGGVIVKREKGEKRTPVLALTDILLPGLHNAENYMAAIAAAGDAADARTIAKVASSFPGVEHRLEFVREKDGVRFYNGSIDSSPTRTDAALSALCGSAPDRPITVILGGYDKKIPFEPLADAVLGRGLVVRAVLNGATAGAIEDALRRHPLFEKRVRDGSFEIQRVPSFESAVLTAAREAKAGETVILSPACASFDQFENFEERGKRFKEIVTGL
ncbi:MAG: UDP-N-acetylmuramoyl-L-alanine--D-glutamate ligase [Clostridia bacterium]|nr:UDP-N-acetylmuramoyl-L-alanine--D-glutamate ligase [Clostridia bacterium]